jgi:tetratricopeptide (TPR) repeat protein
MKKTPLRVWFIGIVGLIALVMAVLMIYRLSVNHGFVRAYANEDYNSLNEEKLLKFNFPESYIPYYNIGNAAYKRGDYTSAISYYTEALKNFPPEKRECLIRINLALSMCNTIDFYNLNSQEKIDTALFVLYKARDVLLEKGCASDDGQGHNADAQQLKEDIDAMIEKLKNPDSGNNSDQPQEDPPQENDDGDSSNSGKSGNDMEKRIQKELEENKKDALEDRKDQQDDLEKWSDYIGGDEDGSGAGGDEDGEGSGTGGQNNPW